MWNAETDAELLRLRNDEKQIWSVIASVLGGSKTACRHHYYRITNPSERAKGFRQTWTKEQEQEVYRLRHVERLSIVEIAKRLNKSTLSVSSKLDRLAKGTRGKVHFEPQPRDRNVPQDRIDDRNRRMAATRDLTSILCGDPAPGQSALCKRQMVTA